MCGLIGASGLIDPNKLRALGCLASSRGKDSAGIGWYADTPRFSKAVGNPAAVFNTVINQDLPEACKAGNVLGHTRAATLGAVTPENAHPFLMDGILFAHNGMISNHATFGRYEVDSQSLIHGIKKRDFSQYEGSVALLWIIGNKMFAYRKGNPLFRGTMGDAVYFSSEETHLQAIGCMRVRELKEGIAYQIAGGRIEDTARIRPNKTGVTYHMYNYQPERNWWQAKSFDNDPRTIKEADTDVCYCEHEAKDHNKENVDKTGWVCYARRASQGLCPCNRYMKQTVHRPKAFKPSLCFCGHARGLHNWTGIEHRCLDHQCGCDAFVLQESSHVPGAICDCGHEFEYHDEKASGWFPCAVLEGKIPCDCRIFVPIDETDYVRLGWTAD